MKTAAFLLLMATAACGLVTTTWAGENPPVLPPVEYDHPYSGTIIMVRPETMEETAKECGNAKSNLGFLLACNYSWGPTMCRIVMAPDKEIEAKGHKPEWVLRHEIGHCNGWAPDHKGARRP